MTRGRKSVGDRAMTDAERQRRRRAKLAEQAAALEPDEKTKWLTIGAEWWARGRPEWRDEFRTTLRAWMEDEK